MRIEEVECQIGVDAQLGVLGHPGHLGTLILGEGFAELFGQGGDIDGDGIARHYRSVY